MWKEGLRPYVFQLTHTSMQCVCTTYTQSITNVARHPVVSLFCICFQPSLADKLLVILIGMGPYHHVRPNYFQELAFYPNATHNVFRYPSCILSKLRQYFHHAIVLDNIVSGGRIGMKSATPSTLAVALGSESRPGRKTTQEGTSMLTAITTYTASGDQVQPVCLIGIQAFLHMEKCLDSV